MQSNVRLRTESGNALRPQRHMQLNSVLLEKATRIARTTCSVLLTGETGVGKGHVARWLHQNGPRGDQQMIPVNCGAIPEHLIDSQLFGHVRGAFTGAERAHEGLVGAANGGTLLLDEVSELPATAQLRLLRLLEEREAQPVGSSKPQQVDVRVLAATNRDLKQCVAAGNFREDLYYRLNVIELRVPALRERTEEIPALFETFNHEFAKLYDQLPVTLTENANAVLQSYDWPGNVRELRTVTERLHVLCPHEIVSVQKLESCGQLRARCNDARGAGVLIEVKPDGMLSQRMQEARSAAVRKALAECGGNVSRAARTIGVHRSTLYRWLAAG